MYLKCNSLPQFPKPIFWLMRQGYKLEFQRNLNMFSYTKVAGTKNLGWSKNLVYNLSPSVSIIYYCINLIRCQDDSIFYKGIMQQLIIEKEIKVSGKPKSTVKMLLCYEDANMICIMKEPRFLKPWGRSLLRWTCLTKPSRGIKARSSCHIQMTTMMITEWYQYH